MIGLVLAPTRHVFKSAVGKWQIISASIWTFTKKWLWLVLGVQIFITTPNSKEPFENQNEKTITQRLLIDNVPNTLKVVLVRCILKNNMC